MGGRHSLCPVYHPVQGFALRQFFWNSVMALLELENVHAYYGNIHALKGVSLNIDKGEIVTLIGANGAGKSTTLRATSGLLRPREGSIRLEGEDLTRYPPHEIVAKGVV